MRKISVVIPVYKPEEEVFEKVKEMLKKQTIQAEIIENWNMPEAKSMNTGIRKAKGEIIIIMSQDCVPENEYWLEKLVKPLEDESVVAVVSDIYLPHNYWKKYPLLTKILTLNERKKQFPRMDMRGCAYRKKDLLKVGLINEDPKIIGIDMDLYSKLTKLGRIVRGNCTIHHLHKLDNKKRIKTLYTYAEGNGKVVKAYGMKGHAFWKRVARAAPFFGFISIIYRYPFDKYAYFFPVYLLFVPMLNAINFIGFCKGLLFNKESIRNTEVLKKKS